MVNHVYDDDDRDPIKPSRTFGDFIKARGDGEKAVKEAVFGWVMTDAPGEMTLGHARSMAAAITRRWNEEAQRMWDYLEGAK